MLVLVTRFSFGFSFGFSFEFSFGTDILLGDFPGQLPANTQSIFLEFGLRREQVEKVPCASPRPCPGFRVQRVRAETKTTGGIFLPECAVEDLNEARFWLLSLGRTDKYP